MGSLVANSKDNNLSAFTSTANFVPSIKICYSQSKVFKESKVKLGNWYIDETDLGNEIKVTALDYRIQFVALTKTGDFKGSIVFGKNDEVHSDPKYKAFVEQNKDNVVNDGIDILCYLPERNIFGVIFCSKKLKKAAMPILDNAGGGSVVTLRTRSNKYEKLEWYEVDVTPTADSVTVPDAAEDQLLTYKAQIVQTAAPVAEDARER
jgi:hypothetical protein